MTRKPRSVPRRQFGVVPYRISADGTVEVLLVTTRETRRWTAPKGWPMKKLDGLETGLREAFEEAGVLGDGGPRVGAFDYLKTRRSGKQERCRVELFAMRVTEERPDWREKAERERRWFTHAAAADAVQEDELKAILLDLPNRLAPGDGVAVSKR